MPSPGVPDWKEASRGGRRSMRGSLPAQLSPLVGRGREIGQVKALVTKHRLVTLTGVGGVGKTRLALQVATDLRRQFSDGAWFVDLTHLQASQLPGPEVRDPDLIAHVVLLALGMPQRAGGSPVEMLISYLTDRQTLVVLDNCEQVGPACAVFVDQLLVACAGVRVLATSREPIAVGGEVIYPVQPLPVPDRDRRADLRDLTRYESVALFVTRAQAVTPGFTLTHHNRDAVAELCRRLDGLPLAIELAVARVRVLAPQQILERVNDRFALLSRGRRDAPGRQQTLRACVEWSFDLCGKPERVLWARLSVFVGGFTLDAVESVCCDELLPAHDLVDVLAGLVDKSIVDRIDSGGGQSEPVRYRMLETLRDYGEERLAQADDQATFRARHRDWCRQLVAAVGAGWSSHRQTYWQARLTEEQPNVRAAIEFCLATPGEAEMVFPIVELMPRAYWGSGVVVSEGLSWLDRALAQAPAPTVARARALVLAGALALHRDRETMERRLDEGQRLARLLGDSYALALAGYTRSVAAYVRNDLTGAVEAAEQGLSFLPSEPEEDPSLRLHLLLQLLWAVALAGDHERARRCYQEIQEIAKHRGEIGTRSAALLGMALVAWRAEETEEADRNAREAVRIRQSTGTIDLHVCGQSIEVLAWTAVAQQRYSRAATLLGAADAAMADRGTPISTLKALTADHTVCDRRTRDALDPASFTSAFRHGQTLSIDDAVAYALEQQPEPSPVTDPDTPTPLTRREHEIADLIAQGLSNQDIAGRLVISPRTVEGHVQHILTKLGFTNRAHVAAWITDRHSDDS